ncbi:MAG: tRNA uridine-5-carboxymethylaminomethyl(34) synthesis GTPase MnmE [Bacilli bacterium]
MVNDTIVAFATPQMKSAIAIIRISGKDSINIVNKIFTKDLNHLPSHTINYGYIKEDSEIIDEVMVSVFKAPHSFTMEDVVEINTHGGIVVANAILSLILSLGARLAKAGEFTQRAYLNGRIDLLEVEAINELIEASNLRASKVAIKGLSSETSKLITHFKDQLLSIIAQIEVKIDYPEYDDIDDYENEELITEIKVFKQSFEEIIKSSKTSQIIKQGLNVAIIGSPNAGKSSLLNAFLEQDKAIVTNIAGTTRDIVEASYQIEGISINFLDTAGLRETDDIIEQIGITKSIEAKENADLILLVIDSSNPIISTYEQELIKSNPTNLIICLNKSDLAIKTSIPGIKISALNKDIKPLKEAIISKLNLDLEISNEKLFLSNARHIALLKQIDKCLENALTALNNQLPSDIIVSDLEEAYDYLNELKGDKYTPSLINELFERFCLGK